MQHKVLDHTINNKIHNAHQMSHMHGELWWITLLDG